MVSKSTKVYEVDGRKVQFNFNTFIDGFYRQRKVEKIKVGEYEEKLADALHVSPDAVHNWRFRCNGPSDICTVQELAKQLSFTDWMLLLKPYSEEEQMQQLTERQKESAKRVYDAIITFLEDFQQTDGFTGVLWYRFAEKGSRDPEQDIYEYAEEKLARVHFVIKKEYFDLHGTTLYDELQEYAYNDLYDIYDGKLSYAYRFEAIPDGNPTTEEDYEKALNRLNEIVEKYI